MLCACGIEKEFRHKKRKRQTENMKIHKTNEQIEKNCGELFRALVYFEEKLKLRMKAPKRQQ